MRAIRGTVMQCKNGVLKILVGGRELILPAGMEKFDVGMDISIGVDITNNRFAWLDNTPTETFEADEPDLLIHDLTDEDWTQLDCLGVSLLLSYDGKGLRCM